MSVCVGRAYFALSPPWCCRMSTALWAGLTARAALSASVALGRQRWTPGREEEVEFRLAAGSAGVVTIVEVPDAARRACRAYASS